MSDKPFEPVHYVPLVQHPDKPIIGDTVYLLMHGAEAQYEEVKYVGLQPGRAADDKAMVAVFSEVGGAYTVRLDRLFIRKEFERSVFTLVVNTKGGERVAALTEKVGPVVGSWDARLGKARNVRLLDDGGIEVLWEKIEAPRSTN